ncbi:acyl-CoA-binding domain-containing protein 5-like isoform X1 [Actinidia eriantha]|uniref:acyl-CoA-binding domain-containing protein 5-like isoform X1 n=1 Tax=Actinidia eriantha TaxID=165200 RepID=UPI00258529F2|nr:acyl-CoA-binding domain-containing protein 5-like isoform X1 [Actinidia eriantha]
MELVQELFLTAFVALIFSFVVAKLVSIAMNGDGEHELGLKSSENVRGERVVEAAKLRVRSSRSKRRVRFVEEVDEFGRRRSVEKSGESRCGGGFEEKMCDSAVICGANCRIEALGLPEKLPERRSPEAVAVAEGDRVKEEVAVTNSDELVVDEGSERTEVCETDDGVVEEGNGVNNLDLKEKILQNVKTDGKIDSKPSSDDIVVAQGKEIRDVERGENQACGIKEEVVLTNLDGLVETDGVSKEEIAVTDLLLEEKFDENAEVDSEIDARSLIHDIVVVQGEEDRDVERRENQERGIEGGLNGGDEKEGMVGADEENRGVKRRENQESGIEGTLNEGDEKEGLGGDDEEDGWEGIERSELVEVFAAAANYVASGGKDDDDRLSNVGSDVQMQMYGLHKVAMEGPCYESQPMALMISSRAKWNAWQRLGNMNPEVAMEKYIALLSDKVPEWMEGKSLGDSKACSSESGITSALDPNTSTNTYNQLNSTKERKLELQSGTDGGDLTGDTDSMNKE